MNVWLVAAAVLLVGLIPCGVVCLRAPVFDALIALELASTIATLVLLLVAQGFDRAPMFDLAVVSATLTFAGGLAFARFLERWI